MSVPQKLFGVKICNKISKAKAQMSNIKSENCYRKEVAAVGIARSESTAASVESNLAR